MREGVSEAVSLSRVSGLEGKVLRVFGVSILRVGLTCGVLDVECEGEVRSLA